MKESYLTTYIDSDGKVNKRKPLAKIRIAIFAIFKFIFDRLFSLIGLVICFIPMLIIAIAIKIDSKGPVFFKQERTGKNGKIFNMLKFRSMVADNDVHDFKKQDQVTKVGKFLRKTSLDELPQLITILLGKMSFIGPRPWIHDYYLSMNDIQRHRYDVRPGLTGLAQANGRNTLSIFDKIGYDLEYIKKYSLWQDIKVVFLTIKAVFSAKGANAGKDTIKNELDDLKNQNKSETKVKGKRK